MSAFWHIIIVGFIMSLPISYGAEFSLYQKNQASTEAIQTLPLAHTARHYDSGNVSWSLGYRHLLDEQWMMEINVLAKNLVSSATNTPLTFLTASHASYRFFRLYYNTYILVGPKFSYMYPMRSLTFPPKREVEIDSEVGAALSVALHFFVTDNWLVSARVDRWRGTKSNRFHGIETGYGISYQIQ
jgi:hypothetical protein